MVGVESNERRKEKKTKGKRYMTRRWQFNSASPFLAVDLKSLLDTCFGIY